MLGTWYVHDAEDGMHLHFLVPNGAVQRASPSALAAVLYTAAAVMARYIAAHEPLCPFMVVSDPEPQSDGNSLYGCVRFAPWPGAGEQYVAENPHCISAYGELMAVYAEHFNADPAFCTLVEPDREHDIGDAPDVNAPGSETAN